MKQDIRKGIKSSFLYKRFAYYQSEGFVVLMKFLERENLVDDFCNEINFKRRKFPNELELDKKNITIWEFFQNEYYSFSFSESKKGYDFWHYNIFENEDFYKIENKLL